MNFNEFVEKVKEEIRDYLPETFEEADISVYEHQKLNQEYTALSIKQWDSPLAPLFNLNEFYNAYNESNYSFESIMEEIAHMATEDHPEIRVETLTDYDSIKDRLFLRVSDAEKNADYLADIPHQTVEDIAITYHVLVAEDDNGTGSFTVTNEMLKRYGITAEQLHEQAVKSSEQMRPLQLWKMIDVLKETFAEDMRGMGISEEMLEEQIEEMELDDNPMYVISNEQKDNGATALFYPGAMEQCAKELGGDFVVLPSSIHEMILMQDTGDLDYDAMKKMVNDINMDQVIPSERLAAEVYHYDATDHVFEKTSDFLVRQAAKEEKQEIGAAKKGSILDKLGEKKEEAKSLMQDTTLKHAPEPSL